MYPEEFRFNYEELKESVVRVELINYNNPEAKELFEKRDKVIKFDFEKMEIIKVLPNEMLDSFLKELSEYCLMMFWRHLDSPQGISIRLIYDNGDFEVLSCNVRYSGSFDSEGSVKRFIGSGIKTELVEEFFLSKHILNKNVITKCWAVKTKSTKKGIAQGLKSLENCIF